jgi:lipopolysaccharide/colanic/teichoic acid biosynthesis glycosyltransferase
MRTGLPRFVEFILALLGLILFSPLLLLAMAGVAFGSPGPIFFRQHRVGMGGQPFSLIKFRSMTVSNETLRITAKGDIRITRFGRFLRKTKIDELPELWNVVKGDLALVGPRPEVPQYVDLSNPLWQRVLQIRPGITDPVTLWLRNEEELLAQVKSDPEAFYLEILQPIKLQRYLEYLKHRSAWADLKVLVGSVLAIISPGRTPPPSLLEIQQMGNIFSPPRR